MGDNGIITKSQDATFRTEITKIKEQVNFKLAQSRIENKTLGEYFEQPTQDEAKDWAKTLKKEIIEFGGEINSEEITYLPEKYIENNGLFDIKNLYYVDKELADGKEKMYLYDQKGDIVFKVPSTRVGLKVVHSIEALDGKSKTNNQEEQLSLVQAESNLVKVGSTVYYEPNLSGFAVEKTKVVYYEKRSANDTSTTQLATLEIPVQEYLDNGKKNEIVNEEDGKTYQFYDYENQRWANILVENNDMKSYWVWVPSYGYKIDGNNTNVIYTNTEGKQATIEGTPQDLPEGYIPHPDFAGGKKGIWVSKYEPILTANTVVDDYPYYIPNMEGFNPETTYLEVYNEQTKSFEETKLSEVSNIKEFSKTHNWFDYNKQIWANIRVYEPESKTESWWVWVPRYAYNIIGNTTNIKFIDLQDRPLDGSTMPSNYVVHSAFTLTEEENGTEKVTQLKGIWASKYEPVQKIGEVGATNQVNPPNLKGYNVDSTYIESYDESTNTFKEQTLRSVLGSGAQVNSTTNVLEKSDIDLSKIQGTWYSYDKQIWANIKVVNDNGTTSNKTDDIESWWVWIPRYAYNILNNETTIIWLDKNGNPLNGKPLPSNYIPHPAFNESAEGIWASKYEPIEKN